MYSLCTINFWVFGFMDVSVLMSSSSLWQMSRESEVFIRLADDTNQHTRRLASTAWVSFAPQGQLLSSGGIFLGDATNNVVEYSLVIELLPDTLSLGISHLQVYLDSQLVVSQLNGVYCVHDPTLHRRFFRVHLLEQSFYYITYFHVPRRLNQVTDTLANQILDWHIAHM
jgi:ribonuclease HI